MKTAAAIVFAIAVAGLYFLSPYWTLLRLEEAVKGRDVAALETLVDWPRVRDGIKQDFRAHVLKQDGLKATESGFAALGAIVGANLSDTLIDGMITSSRIASGPLAENFSLASSMTSRGFVAPARFHAHFQPDERMPEAEVILVMEFSAFAWRVTRVLVPNLGVLIEASKTLPR